jgi:energy-coupling factor transporter ATP-binding protein EcfA2
MVKNRDGAKVLVTEEPRIEFDNVNFSYPRAEEISLASLESAAKAETVQSGQVLRNLSFVAEPGTMTALVGQSGAGKTTISALLPRLYDVTDGAIKIDGIRFATSWFNAPLPVSVKSFNASMVNNSASLVWNTNNENNVDGFTIERSNDGNTYTNIGFVAAKNTASNTYTFNDHLQIKNATYYRLKIIDKDGSFKYSSVIVMNAKSGIKLDIYPNPAINNLVITHPQSTVNSTVKIINIDGKNLITQNLQNGATQSTIDVSKLIKGNYLVVFENDGTRSATQFVKQ